MSYQYINKEIINTLNSWMNLFERKQEEIQKLVELNNLGKQGQAAAALMTKGKSLRSLIFGTR